MHFPALEKAVASLTKVLGRPDRARRSGVENQQIGIGADPNGSLPGIEPENAGRVLRQRSSHPPDGQSSLDHPLAVPQWHEGFYAWRAKGNDGPVRPNEDVLLARLLGLLRGWRVIAAHARDVALLQSFPEGRLVGSTGGTERRGEL